MRILFIVPYVPNRIRVRPYNLIRHLAAHGHEVTVLTLWSNQGERADAEALEKHCHRVIALPLPRWRSLCNCLRALPTSVPLQAVYCWSPSLAHVIQSEIRNSKFAIAHVEHLRGARYGLWLKSPIANSQSAICNLQFAIPIIWDSVDCISLLFEQALQMGPSLGSRLKAWLDLERTRRYEGWLVRQFDRVLVTSAEDARALQELANPKSPIGNRQSPILVLPNGVDLDYFTPTDEPRDPATLVYLGRMSYHANVAAVLYLVRDIMPLVWAQRPEVRLLIVGSDPPRQIRELATTQSKIGNRQSKIMVTGTVPDVRPYLAHATVSVAPIVYGAGTQFKLLESLAMETAVVTTSKAATPLGVRSGEQVLVADTASDFAQAVLRLLGDPELRARIGQAGRRYVEKHHDWDGIAARLEEIYASMTREP